MSYGGNDGQGGGGPGWGPAGGARGGPSPYEPAPQNVYAPPAAAVDQHFYARPDDDYAFMASTKVAAPATVMMVTTAIGIVLAVYQMLDGLLKWDNFSSSARRLPPELETIMGASLALTALGIVCGGFSFYGFLKMKKLESWGISLAATILSMLPITGPCCCLNMFIGIWALVVLLDGQVKNAFHS